MHIFMDVLAPHHVFFMDVLSPHHVFYTNQRQSQGQGRERDRAGQSGHGAAVLHAREHDDAAGA